MGRLFFAGNCHLLGPVYAAIHFTFRREHIASNAMLSDTDRGQITRTLRRDNNQLNAACQRRWGVSALMFRVVKFLFYMVTLAFTVYLIELVEVEPLLAIGVAVLLISGPEAFELYLIRADILAEQDRE